MAQSTDDAIKQRIISHMNKDHPDSLSRYLEHYAGVSHFSARSPKLEDFTLSSLKISSAGETYSIPISPPLSSYQEARPRLINMHEECGQQLGRDSVTVKNFRWPGAGGTFNLCGVLVGLYCFADGANFAPGSFLARTLFRPVPQVAKFAETYHWQFFWAIIAIHVGESILMMTKMKRYNVPLFSRVWWLYVGFMLGEGYTCAVRLQAEVKEERSKKEAKDSKH